MGLEEQLDLELAWDKSKSNLRDTSRIFVNNPAIIDIIDSRSTEWVEYLSHRLENEEYNPDESRVINIPKKGWHIRPGNILRIEDLVVYSALVIDLYDDIRSEIEWSAGDKRFSRILFDDKTERGWIKYPSDMWKDWREQSIALADEFEYVVFTDVAGYFENVELRLLHSDLNQLQPNEATKNQLMECLRRWSRTGDRGLPQGYYPSDILSELYMNRIDERLDINDITYTRYSDNRTLFCESKREAKNALRLLTELYRERGLNLQGHKSELVDSEQAKKRIQEDERIIHEIKSEGSGDDEGDGEPKRRRRAGGDPYTGGNGNPISGNPYTDGGEKQWDDPEEPAVDEELLEREFDENFASASGETFNKHLFRFLITRLGRYDNDTAVDYCIERLKDGKTESRAILGRYFSRLSNREAIAETLAEVLEEDGLIYDFHTFCVIRWFWNADIESEAVVQTIRKALMQRELPKEAKNYAIAYLGKQGNVADIDYISELYEEEFDRITRAIIVYSLKEMERSQRNSLYRRAKDDNIFCEFAVEYAKERY